MGRGREGGVGERGGTANNISSVLSLFLYYLNEHRCLLDGKGREKAAARCLHSVFVWKPTATATAGRIGGLLASRGHVFYLCVLRRCRLHRRRRSIMFGK